MSVENFVGDFCLKARIMINALMHVLFIFFFKKTKKQKKKNGIFFIALL